MAPKSEGWLGTAWTTGARGVREEGVWLPGGGGETRWESTLWAAAGAPGQLPGPTCPRLPAPSPLVWWEGKCTSQVCSSPLQHPGRKACSGVGPGL